MPEETTVKKVGAATTHQLSEAQIAERRESLSDMRLPFRVEGVTLMSPGTWNRKDYTPKEIKAAFQRTDWDDVEVRALFNEHDDHDSRDWIGEVRNPRMDGNDLIGDIDVVTADEARKLAYGARFGISPKVSGRDDRNTIRDYTYDNFSLVLDPAVKTTYLNSEQENSDDEQDVKNVMVKSTMSDTEDTEELSSEELSKLEEIVTTVENSDVEELAEVISPFMGGRSSEELQSHIADVIENSDDGEDEEEMSEHEEEEEEMMRDMEEIARQAVEKAVSEMEMADDDEDEEELSVEAIAEQVADKIEVENSDDEDDSSEEVEALKEELSQIKDQIASDDDEETIENKTPNPGSQSTGADDTEDVSVQEMSDRDIDKGAAKYLLRSQKKRIR